MARMKALSTIEAEITRTEEELSKIKKKYDSLAEKLLSLQEEKQKYEARQIMEAYKRSNRSFQDGEKHYGFIMNTLMYYN